MNIITVYLEGGVWLAHSEGFRGLFETDVLPTAYTSVTAAETVVAELEALNPGALIVLQEEG